MPSQLDLVAQAKIMPYDLKKQHLLSQKETDIHKLLLSLINKLSDKYSVEITHSKDEHGRDLVVKERDPLGTQYIGVVVKKGDGKGDLTGETSGVIDDILSQARQAFAWPCLLHELEARAVRITQLWIFFIGRFTNNASGRIERELGDLPIRLFALEPTIELFTNNYPEIFFNPILAEFIEANLSKLENITLTTERHTSLPKKIVNPWVSKWEGANEITEALSTVIRSKKMPFQKLAEVISAKNRIILTGEPGVGKTTAMIKIASDMLKNNFMLKSKDLTRRTLETPILIKAKEAIQKTPDVIYSEFMTVAELESQLSIKVLLIDGLDEISIEDRDKCLRNAISFADKFNCGLVVSCRKIPTLMKVVQPFAIYELLPLDYNQAITLVQQYVQDTRLVEILKSGLLHDEFKIQLTPLAIELLIEVATYEREVPASLVEIFERYTDVACGKYDKGRGIESVFEHHVKKRFLAELAWNEFYLKEELEIPRLAFDQFAKNYSETYSWDDSKFKEFVGELEHSGLLGIDDNVKFWHRSFLDFFIAYRISEKRAEYPTLDRDIATIYFNDLWTDVAFYYVGIQRVISPEIVSNIAEYPLDDFDMCIYKVLVGRLLQAGWHTPSKEKVQAINIGLQNIDHVRNYVDKVLSPETTKLPTIFSDFFYMYIIEYAYGSMTLLVETNTICDYLIDNGDLTSLRNCILLLWAQRLRLTEEEKTKRVTNLLTTLTTLEKEGKLLVRDKFVNLFMLEQIEEENKKVLRSIRRKIDRTKKLYPSEMRRLLPTSKAKTTVSFPRTKRRKLKTDL
ncbi:NACHT domain-containing protein [Chloroflexota bacterium]